MGNGFSLYRWFRNVSIARKLYFTVGIMAVLIGVELFVLLFSLDTLSSLRAYVGGEGLWSKAQKDAVFHLYRYGVSRTEQDYQLFEQFMRAPIGDAKARRELLSADPDKAAARQGFLEGRNNPGDIDGMISLFTDFGNVSYIRKAIDIWGEAEPILMQLRPIAAQLHAEIDSPSPSQARIEQLLASIYAINQTLTAYEDQFSFTLGEGSRWLERVVLRLLFAMALTVEATGLLLALSVSRGIQKGLNDIIGAASAFSAGELDVRVKIASRDEIGVVAGSFNELAETLEKRVGELAELNQQLRREIDERERAEETLRQSENMRALGQLTGGVAHDFNNLLGVIIGSVELLAGAVRDRPEYAELAREILDSALSGSQLTRRLLAVGRKQPLQPQRVDLDALLSREVELLRRTLGETILIEAARPPGLWFTSVDPSQIGDALLNLALNARDAMPHGGRLTIEAANVHLDAQDAAAFGEMREGDYVVPTVTDTGTGMPAYVLQRAIEPFFTTKPPSVGSGLGLSMVYGFAKQSGGHLDIGSDVGIGTRVRLYLPRAQEGTAASTDAPRAAVPGPGGSETILLVDDNQSLLQLTRRHLGALGYRVITATSAASALAIVESGESIDLVFTDIVMPGQISGVELGAAAEPCDRGCGYCSPAAMPPGRPNMPSRGYCASHTTGATWPRQCGPRWTAPGQRDGGCFAALAMTVAGRRARVASQA